MLVYATKEGCAAIKSTTKVLNLPAICAILPQIPGKPVPPAVALLQYRWFPAFLAVAPACKRFLCLHFCSSGNRRVAEEACNGALQRNKEDWR